MILKYSLLHRNLILTNPEELVKSDDVSFIQCCIDLHSSVFRSDDVLIAVFKSASYNIKEEVILSVSYDTVDVEVVNIRGYAFVPTKVFEHGGVIQLMIYKKGRVSSDRAQDATNTVEFFLEPRRYVPLTVPQMWQHVAHEVSDMWDSFITDVSYDHTNRKIQKVKAGIESDVVTLSEVAMSGSYTDLIDKPAIPIVPSNLSDLNNDMSVSDFPNDAGYLTSFLETDPVFTASDAYGITASDISNWDNKSDFSGDYNDLINKPVLAAVATSGSYNDLSNKPTIPTVPTNLSDFNNDMDVSDFPNDAGYLTSFTETDPTVPAWAKAPSKPSYTAAEVDAVPTTRKVNGKALSSDITLSASDVAALPSNTFIPSNTSDLVNDSGFITGFTETDPVFSASDAAGITANDIINWNAKSDFSGSYVDLTNKPSIPSKTSDLTNDEGFTSVSVTRHTTSGTNIADIEVDGVTTKLYAPTGGGGGGITDVEVDGVSVVTGGVAEIDLTGKSDVGHTHTKSAITDFPTLATVATSGSYNDLSNKPSIPTYSEISEANIKQGSSSTVGLITGRRARQAVETYSPVKDVTVDGVSVVEGNSADIDLTGKSDVGHTHTVSAITDFPTIPENTSDLINDSGFITLGDLPIYNGGVS